jgi:signal transduction histidine kinase
VREARRVAALDRLMGSQADRRIRNYPATDQGPRIGKLWDILTGNNQRAKESIARLNAASARLDRWIDYYDRKITWLVEGQLGGPAFRQARAEAAAAQRRKVAHAQRRADMAKAVAQEVRGLVAALMGQQEKTLVRRRQVEGWTRPHGREQDRGRARHPEGRTRDPR